MELKACQINLECGLFNKLLKFYVAYLWAFQRGQLNKQECAVSLLWVPL